MMKKLYEEIIERVGVGIHAVNQEGKTIIYNKKMREMEAMDKEDVLHKDVRDVFRFQENQSSTLLKSLQNGEEIVNVKQTYFNNRGVEITTVNNTFPLTMDGEISAAVEIATDVTRMERLMRQNLRQTKTDFTFDHIIGKSSEIKEVIALAKRATRTNSNVLIIGETGTGKELFAQSIHAESDRSDSPFITQNCAALPDTLIEGILFGTTKGAFTGAIDSPGLFEQAQGGTILLDELNSLNISLQAKLLRVLQERKVRRIGGSKEIPIDVRVIATVNEDPIDAISNNRLRKDLYYRLAVVTLFIPPLRERYEDIPVLIKEFIQKYNELFKLNVKSVSNEVLQFFEAQSWPGNVRELEHVIEASMNLVNYEQVIEFDHLPYQYRKSEVKMAASSPEFTESIDEAMGLTDQLALFEKQTIEHYLHKHHSHITNTAIALGISRQSLQYRMKRLDIRVQKI
ncbi:sigma 54-interacting transcriptional regulator [Ureibacillus chungkukjangi]|uniref:sigma-54 interaction domain-containing protein n=1 Tax=Ureibacillus chungkukjangi TaxID=1202712 RepID=UPI002040F332|nr:sigma 54-interacting transcriptional regulator [Ureibacillus chungkukjangi]MCM3389604.1 sigma 54-interacting transcriptional regulator [Ureibacillus chungkukjangi]